MRKEDWYAVATEDVSHAALRSVAGSQTYGGATSTIFPEVERALMSTDVQKGIEYVASRKRADRYISVMDFLFCELFTSFRASYQRFYRGAGQPLKEVITEAERQCAERVLLTALHIAQDWKITHDGPPMWDRYRPVVITMAQSIVAPKERKSLVRLLPRR